MTDKLTPWYEGRAKIIQIGHRDLLDILAGRVKMDVPDGANVETLFICQYTRCICVVVSHPSYDIVPEGTELPRIMSTYHVVEQPEEPVHVRT